MDKLIIEHLSDKDFESISYKSVSAQLNNKTTYKSNTYDNFAQYFSGLEKFEKDTIVTILSHGHQRGITTGTWQSLITWAELLKIVSNKKGDHKIYLNLIAVCNSSNIIQMSNFCNHKIDEFWVSNNEVISISKALLASQSTSFDYFYSNLEDEEKELYSKITAGNSGFVQVGLG